MVYSTDESTCSITDFLNHDDTFTLIRPIHSTLLRESTFFDRTNETGMRLEVYQTLRPTYLKETIDSFNFYKWDAASKEDAILMLPEGIIEVIIVLNGEVLNNTDYTDSWQTRINSFVGGLHNKSYKLSATTEGRLFSIRFKPGKFSEFTKIPIDKLKNLLVPLEDIFQSNGRELQHRIHDSKDEESWAKLAEDFFIKRYAPKQQEPTLQAIQYINDEQGRISIEALSKKVCMSSSNFRKRFREEVGLSPKQYASVIRLNAIIKEIRSFSPDQSLTDLGYSYNYFDQAHLIRDVKNFTQLSPKQLRKAKMAV